MGGGKAVEGRVIGRMDGDKLALQVGGQFGDGDPAFGGHALDLVAIILRCRRLFQIEQPPVPGRDLHADIAAVGGPFGNGFPRVERCCVTGELRQEQCRAP
jgi:hypothetical protein